MVLGECCSFFMVEHVFLPMGRFDWYIRKIHKPQWGERGGQKAEKISMFRFFMPCHKIWIFISQPRVWINTVMFIGLSISELGIRFRVNGPALGLSLLQDLVSVKDGHLWCRVVSASSNLLPSLSENGLIWLNLINLWSAEIAIYIFFPSKIISNETKVLPWLALGKVAMSSTLGVDESHQS